ncbi:MAG: hypothetical protein NEHIOOID_01129 [Holosporales bacterium]
MTYLILIFSIFYVQAATFDPHLTNCFSKLRGVIKKNGPKCFISRAYSGETDEITDLHKIINEGLQRAGIKTYMDINPGKRGLALGQRIDSFIDNIKTTNFVLCLMTPRYTDRDQAEASGVSKEVDLISKRLCGVYNPADSSGEFLIGIILEGNIHSALPNCFQRRLVAEHQGKNLKRIFNDILFHIYFFYFTQHRHSYAIKDALEGYFGLMVPLHASLDTASLSSTQGTQSPQSTQSNQSTQSYEIMQRLPSVADFRLLGLASSQQVLESSQDSDYSVDTQNTPLLSRKRLRSFD